MKNKIQFLAKRYLARQAALRVLFSIFLFTALTGSGLVSTQSESSENNREKSGVGWDSLDSLSGEARGVATTNPPTVVSSGLVDAALGLPGTPQAPSLPDTVITYCNATGITINNISPFPTKSSPYPSEIFVTGMTGTISRVTVTLNDITHTFPDDIEVLLVSPSGQKVTLMGDVGGGLDAVNVDITFDDTAANSLPDTGGLPSGRFKPTYIGTGSNGFPAPAPPGPYSATLAAFNGTNPNGTWSLYVVDDSLGDGGNIAGGWCLEILPSINHAPIANPQSLTTAEDTPLPITLTGSDVDGDALTFVVTSPPASGTLSGTTPNLSYMPNSNFNGSDSFTFTVNDGALSSTTATVSIIVTPINDPPIISSLVASPNIGTAHLQVSFSAAASDIDGSISSVQWDFNGDGIADQTTPTLSTSTTYQTGGVFNAVATVIDNLGGTASSSVTISVRDFALSATPASQSVNPGSSTAYTISITSLAGFNSAVSCTTSVSPQTNGINANVSPGSLVPSGTAFLTVDTTPSAAIGNYTITVTGTSGTLIRSTTVTLSITTAPQVQDFTLQSTPTLQSAVQSTAFSTGISTEVSIISLNGFTGPVSLSISGLPAGATASFSSNPVTPTALSQLAVVLPVNTATGTYSLTITGASGNLSHSVPITLNVIPPPAAGNTPASSGPIAVAIGAGVTATYSSIASAGTTSVTTSTTGAPPPAGFKLAGVYYEISTTAVFSGTVTICINYEDSPNERNYQLMHKSAGGNWERVTLPGYPDTVANIICGEVTSFSEFAAMEMEPLITGGGQSGTVDQYLTPVSVTVYPSGQVQQITDRVVTIPVGTTRVDVSYRFGPGATPSSLSVEFNGVELLAPGSIPDTATGVVVHGLGSLRSRNTLIGVIGGNTSNARDRDRLTLVFP